MYFSTMKTKIPEELLKEIDPHIYGVYAEFYEDDHVLVVYNDGTSVLQRNEVCVVDKSMFPIRDNYYKRN